ncbi:MAG: hypothetical protein JSV12_06220 [Candidatus Bathyarchaeota archaeon]|nr:MAG: hypothetical protein JSV12_06220 [Candidatus Bathyarchaeota archaeon]
MMSLKRFLLIYFLILLVTFLLVVLLPITFEPDQEPLRVDLRNLTAHIEDFSDMKIRTIGTVKSHWSYLQYEGFWLATDKQDSSAIPVAIRSAELSVPSENASIAVSGTIEYYEFEGGFFYLNASSWNSAEDVVIGTGTVIFCNFEGGFYGIVSDNGTHYDTHDLSKKFQVDGLRVRFEIKILRIACIHQWGISASIRHIKKLD